MSRKRSAKIFISVNRSLRAQILITTLILLMLISITVVVISVTVARNNKEVFNNLEYERSYNSAEGKLISVAEKLSDPKLDLSIITTTGSANPLGDLGGSCNQLNNSKYYCSFEEQEGESSGSASSTTQTAEATTRRTIVTIEESNEVIGYEIGSDEYFDVVLFKNKADSGYKGKLSIEWIGESGLELELISETNNGQVKSVQEVVDNTGKIYSSTGNHGYGILKKQRVTAAKGVNTIEIDLNNAKVGANAKLRYLRVRSVNNQTGTALTIKPVQDTSLPKQVRRIEAFSYQSEGVESSAPVVITQLPLSPAVVSPLTKVASYTSIRNPVCGDGATEGAEDCDDGNLVDTDECANDCRKKCNIYITSERPWMDNIQSYSPGLADRLRRLFPKYTITDNVNWAYAGIPDLIIHTPFAQYGSCSWSCSGDWNCCDRVLPAQNADYNQRIVFISKYMNTTNTMIVSDGSDLPWYMAANFLSGSFGVNYQGNYGDMIPYPARPEPNSLPAFENVTSIGQSTAATLVKSSQPSNASYSECQIRMLNKSTGQYDACLVHVVKTTNGKSATFVASYGAMGYMGPAGSPYISLPYAQYTSEVNAATDTLLKGMIPAACNGYK